MSKYIQDEVRMEMDVSAYLSKLVYNNKYFALDGNFENEFTIPGSDKKYTIISTSLKEGFDTQKLFAFAVKDSDGNIYIVYRGTGDGKWIDNAIGLFEDSPVQNEAREFYNKIIEKEVLKDPDFNGRIITTGHSKGGNLAQYVTMESEYGNLVDNCYSIDGQGFSNEAYERFSKMSDYYDRIKKMYSINGQNDYVDPLGKIIIPKENTFFVKNTEMTASDIFNYFHRIDYIMNDGGLNWDYTEVNGERVYNYDLEPGPVNKFIAELSANMMELNEEELEDCAITIMFLLESTIGDINEVADGYRNFATTEEKLGFINVGIPLIIRTLRESENTDALLETLGLGISKDHWLVNMLLDGVSDFSKDMTIDELEGYLALFKEVSDYSSSKGFSLKQLIDYIMDDPIRLIEVYASLDLSKKMINEAILKVLAIGVVGKMILNVCFPSFSVLVEIVAAIGIVYLTANHIIKNWDTIWSNIKKVANQVKDEIVRLYNEVKDAVVAGVNNWVSSLCVAVEGYITKGVRVANKLIDGATDVLNFLKDQTVKAINRHLMVAHPLMYIIASKVYKAVSEPVRINLCEISDCVDRMNRLATRIERIDLRLDSLYWRLAQNNIEEGEGLFTSLANIYNLFRADLNVDEGAAIRRKARALSELYDGFKCTDEWVMEIVPKKI